MGMRNIKQRNIRTWFVVFIIVGSKTNGFLRNDKNTALFTVSSIDNDFFDVAIGDIVDVQLALSPKDKDNTFVRDEVLGVSGFCILVVIAIRLIVYNNVCH